MKLPVARADGLLDAAPKASAIDAELAKLEALAGDVLAAGERVQARQLARLAGQVLSMQTALGLVCRVRSRYINHCLRPAAAAQSYVMRLRRSRT
jgi:hypothetical protein